MRSLLLPLCLIVSGCTSFVSETVARLNALDPLTADPGLIEVAIGLPDGIEIVQDSAKLQLSMSRADTDETLERAFTLSQSRVPDAGSSPPGTKDETVTVFAIRAADLEPMRAMQVQAREWKEAAGPNGSGSLSVGMGACSVGDGPQEDALASIWIRFAPDEPFAPLINQGKIDRVLDVSDLEPC